jgi:hypothetical protein
MRGRASRNGFAITVYHFGTRPRRITEASGRLVAEPAGTRIIVRLAMSPLDAACLVFWFGFAIAFAITPGWFAIDTPAAASPEAPAGWLLLGLPLVGLAVCLLRRWASRDDDVLIQEMLVGSLDAEVVNGEPGH